MKREKDEHNQEMEIVYDSRSKEYMIKRIEAFTDVKMLDHRDDTLSLPNSGRTLNFNLERRGTLQMSYLD